MLRGQREARRDALRAHLPCRRPPPARPWTSPRRGRPWARRRLPPTRAMPGPRPGARRTQATRAQMLQSGHGQPDRCCRPSASRAAGRAAGGWPRRAAIMICWRGGWARPRRRWTASARRSNRTRCASNSRPRWSSAAAGEMLQCRASWTSRRAGLGSALSEAEADCERLQRRRDELDRRAGAGLAVAAAERQARAATSGCSAAGAPAASPWAAVPRSGAAPGRCLAARRLAARRRRGRAGQPEFRHPRAAGHPGALRLRRPVAEAGRPTLLVLDDALVHADEGRRDFMKRRCSMPRHATRS